MSAKTSLHAHNTTWQIIESCDECKAIDFSPQDQIATRTELDKVENVLADINANYTKTGEVVFGHGTHDRFSSDAVNTREV